MSTPPTRRDTFPLRFKDARNREALKRMSELTGLSMTVIAEQAIEHEVSMLSADLELRLTDALDVVRSYTAQRDLDGYLDAAAAGEGSDLGPGLHSAAPHAAAARRRAPQGAAALGVLAAFARS